MISASCPTDTLRARVMGNAASTASPHRVRLANASAASVTSADEMAFAHSGEVEVPDDREVQGTSYPNGNNPGDVKEGRVYCRVGKFDDLPLAAPVESSAGIHCLRYSDVGMERNGIEWQQSGDNRRIGSTAGGRSKPVPDDHAVRYLGGAEKVCVLVRVLPRWYQPHQCEKKWQYPNHIQFGDGLSDARQSQPLYGEQRCIFSRSSKPETRGMLISRGPAARMALPAPLNSSAARSIVR